jgi:branched-chain amino acid transport system ATP-binding protein
MLEIKGLNMYFGGLPAINNLDLSIEEGDFVGLIGPNGAGKTTLFNLITGFLKPTEGEIYWQGKGISGKRPSFIADAGIARTFQNISIFPEMTVLRNVEAACHLNPKTGFWESILHTSGYRRKEKRSILRATEIIQFVGLDSVKEVLAENLPHGHKRILGIALALAANPKLLLLDEPLCGMNKWEINQTKAIIQKAWKTGITILLIEHNMRATMSLCSRIVVLNFGQKIAEGLPQEIRKNKEVVKAYLGTGEYAASDE